MSKLRIAVAGVNGRMGRCLVQAVTAAGEKCELVAATEHPESSVIGADAGEIAGVGRLGVAVVPSLRDAAAFDVLIDFTRPQSSLDNLAECVSRKSKVVLGTTGGQLLAQGYLSQPGLAGRDLHGAALLCPV